MIKATDRKLVVGLEIGTAKVATLVGEILPDGVVTYPKNATQYVITLTKRASLDKSKKFLPINLSGRTYSSWTGRLIAGIY